MTDLKKTLAKIKAKTKTPSKGKPKPVWKGPDHVDGGITFSLLSRFLVCRERFRLYAIDGWAVEDRFNHKLEFGSMWHVCEENYRTNWRAALNKYKLELMRKYQLQREEIHRWAETVRVMFGVYLENWKGHEDELNQHNIETEKVFNIPYVLADSGRVVRLRGKRDKVDRLKMAGKSLIYLQENKTKSRVNEIDIKTQLTFDLQTMIYLTVLHWENDHDEDGEILPSNVHRLGSPLGGIRYNVVRRPELRQGKKESVSQFITRLEETVREEAPTYFMRWKCEVSDLDIRRFRLECLDPILNSLWNWWVMATYDALTQKDLDGLLFGHHWRHPYGVYNVLNEGGTTDLDALMMNGSTIGLTRVTNLYPELSS